jgi:hypothetical protein
MAANAPSASFKLSDITGPYPLLGAFLLIVESLLGFWIYRAESSTERIIAGLLMVALLAGFLIVVVRMQRATVSIPDPPNLPGQLTAGTQLATKQEIETPEAERIAGPDRSYLINKPPPRWTVRELTHAEMLGEVMSMEQSARQTLWGTEQGAREVLVFRSPHDTEILPIPGKTLIDGRRLPSALTIVLPTRLTILPLERYAPPLFVERPLLHNFSIFAGQVAAQGLVTLKEMRSGTLPNSQREYFQAELRQEVRSATVNGREGVDVDANITVIAIEGELKDHLLLLNYASLPGSHDAQLDQDLADLLSLASSFRPLETVDVAGRKKELSAKYEGAFNSYLETNKEQMFANELTNVLLRYSEEDLADQNKRADAIRILRPFEASATELQIEDEELDQFWSALKKAEAGDASEFKSVFAQLRALALSGEEPNELTPEDPKQLPAE